MRIRANCHGKTAGSESVLYISLTIMIGITSFLYAPALSAQTTASKAPGKMIATFPGSQAPVMDNKIFTHVLIDQFEDRTNGPDNELRWDGEAWVGTDMNKL